MAAPFAVAALPQTLPMSIQKIITVATIGIIAMPFGHTAAGVVATV